MQISGTFVPNRGLLCNHATHGINDAGTISACLDNYWDLLRNDVITQMPKSNGWSVLGSFFHHPRFLPFSQSVPRLGVGEAQYR